MSDGSERFNLVVSTIVPIGIFCTWLLCLINLLDVFKDQASEKWNLVPDEVTRLKFVNKLNDMYIEEFNITKGEVWNIYTLASGHPPIVYNKPPEKNHAYANCDYCKIII